MLKHRGCHRRVARLQSPLEGGLVGTLVADAEKAAKIGYVLFRYMRARHRFKHELVERPLPAHELAELAFRENMVLTKFT